MKSAITIPLASVELAYAAARMRRANRGRTCQLAAVSRAPILTADCHDPRMHMPAWLDECRRVGLSNCTCTTLNRGRIVSLIERTRLNHGLAEVRKTWGTGIRTLMAEPRFTLNGGAR